MDGRGRDRLDTGVITGHAGLGAASGGFGGDGSPTDQPSLVLSRRRAASWWRPVTPSFV
jgi:hypothetical protein